MLPNFWKNRPKFIKNCFFWPKKQFGIDFLTLGENHFFFAFAAENEKNVAVTINRACNFN